MLVLGLIAIKALVLALIAPLLGVAKAQRWLFAALLAQAGEFAFVVFGVARQARVLPGSWEALLTAAVAISMAFTPLMVLAHEKLAARRAAAQSREADVIEHEGAEVIIVGFGRYGQIVGQDAVRAGREGDGARSRSRSDRHAAALRFQGLLRRRDARRPARGGGRGESAACW